MTSVASLDAKSDGAAWLPFGRKCGLDAAFGVAAWPCITWVTTEAMRLARSSLLKLVIANSVVCRASPYAGPSQEFRTGYRAAFGRNPGSFWMVGGLI